MSRTWGQWWSGKSTPVKAASIAGGVTTTLAAMILAVPFITDLESGPGGPKLQAYKDVVGVWTICDGETEGVRPDEVRTAEACKQLTQSRIGQFMIQVDAAIMPEVAPQTLAAATSFAYNVGINGFRASQALKHFNEGNLGAGCVAMMNWNGLRVNGVKYDCNKPEFQARINGCKGLVSRRKKEVKLCLEGGIGNVR